MNAYETLVLDQIDAQVREMGYLLDTLDKMVHVSELFSIDDNVSEKFKEQLAKRRALVEELKNYL